MGLDYDIKNWVIGSDNFEKSIKSQGQMYFNCQTVLETRFVYTTTRVIKWIYNIGTFALLCFALLGLKLVQNSFINFKQTS